MAERTSNWVLPALLQAAVFTAVFVGLNLLLADDPGWFLALFAAFMFAVFFGISARAQRRRR